MILNIGSFDIASKYSVVLSQFWCKLTECQPRSRYGPRIIEFKGHSRLNFRFYRPPLVSIIAFRFIGRDTRQGNEVPVSKVFIKTHGCQMNEYDSSRMLDLLKETHGYEITESEDEADLLLLNTCSIRERRRKRFFINWVGGAS